MQFVPIGQLIDRSGCAGNFAPTVQTTLTDGDGLKTVGVEFGDGARTPCAGICRLISLLGTPILGNVSVAATDKIGLDTVKPVAIAVQSAFAVTRGTSVTFNSSTSTDSGTGASGIDPTLTTWNFSDGSAVATGAKVTHTYTKDGTFVGQLRVRDRAGNVSDVRNFAVTVTPAPGDTTAGGGSLNGISGTAAFTVSSFKVKARYLKSALSGSIRVTGSSTQAGALRAEIRSPKGNTLIKRIRVAALSVGPFVRTVKLPATLLPGSDAVNLIGPGGTLTTTLKLTAPREGVIRSGRIAGSRVTFVLAAQPVKALRTKLSVRWTLGKRTLAVIPVGSATRIRASLPAGASLGSGKLVATLQAGSKAIGSATKRIR